MSEISVPSCGRSFCLTRVPNKNLSNQTDKWLSDKTLLIQRRETVNLALKRKKRRKNISNWFSILIHAFNSRSRDLSLPLLNVQLQLINVTAASRQSGRSPASPVRCALSLSLSLLCRLSSQISSSPAMLTFGEFLINIIRQLWWEICQILPLFSPPPPHPVLFPCHVSHVSAF